MTQPLTGPQNSQFSQIFTIRKSKQKEKEYKVTVHVAQNVLTILIKNYTFFFFIIVLFLPIE